MISFLRERYSFSRCIYYLIIAVLICFLLPKVSLAQEEYPPLKKVSQEFPEPGKGVKKILYPYEHEKAEINVDGSKFSIYIPAGAKNVNVTLGSNKKSNLTVKSEISEIGSYKIKFGYGGTDSYKQLDVVDSTLDTSNWSSGKWVFFQFDNGAVPDLYYVKYRSLDTNHASYSQPPANHPTPPEDSEIPEGDGSGGETPSDSEDEDPVYKEPPSDRPDNPLSYLDGTDRQNPFGSDEETGDDDQQQNPPVQTQAPELNSITGYQQAMNQVQEVSAAHLDENSYLAPKLNLDLDLVLSGNNGQIDAAGYAMLEINDNFYTVVPDALGNLSLMPIGEVGVRPYCTEVEIDLENSAWYCDAFQIIQEFFEDNNINGIEELQQWHSQGEDIIFYFGFAPGGNLDEFQGAAFQIVS